MEGISISFEFFLLYCFLLAGFSRVFHCFFPYCFLFVFVFFPLTKTGCSKVFYVSFRYVFVLGISSFCLGFLLISRDFYFLGFRFFQEETELKKQAAWCMHFLFLKGFLGRASISNDKYCWNGFKPPAGKDELLFYILVYTQLLYAHLF